MSLSVDLKAKIMDLTMDIEHDIRELDLMFKEKRDEYREERKALMIKLGKWKEAYNNGAIQPDMFLEEM